MSECQFNIQQVLLSQIRDSNRFVPLYQLMPPPTRNWAPKSNGPFFFYQTVFSLSSLTLLLLQNRFHTSTERHWLALYSFLHSLTPIYIGLVWKYTNSWHEVVCYSFVANFFANFYHLSFNLWLFFMDGEEKFGGNPSLFIIW